MVITGNNGGYSNVLVDDAGDYPYGLLVAMAPDLIGVATGY